MAAKKIRNKSKITVPPNGHQKTKAVPFLSNTPKTISPISHQFFTLQGFCRELPVRGNPKSLNLAVNMKRLFLGSLVTGP